MVGGAQYDGHWLDRLRVEFAASRDGRVLRFFEVGFTAGRCSNGMRFSSGNAVLAGHPITEAGRSSYSTAFRSDSYIFTPAGKRIGGREQLSFTIRFARDRATGEFRDRFRAAHLRCSSGWVSFTAFRDGTPRAPLINPLVDTGTIGPQQSAAYVPLRKRPGAPRAAVRSSTRAYIRLQA